MRRLVALFLVLAPAAADAADRTVGIGSFTRLRVEGPIEVHVVTGRPPHAAIRGDRRAAEAVDLQVNGEDMVIRRGAGDDQADGIDTGPLTVELATTTLAAATLIGGSRVTVDRMKGERVDLMVNGSGTLSVGAVTGDQLTAILVGQGSMTVAGGRVSGAQLTANGNGTLDTGALEAGDLVARLDGQGSLTTRARYTADAINSGLGTLTIEGSPKCTSRGSTGPLRCGTAGRTTSR